MAAIGIDAMGGDYAPQKTVEGAILALNELGNEDSIVLVGKKAEIDPILTENNCNSEKLTVVNADEVIDMSDHPTRALSKKPNSSIAIGFGLLKAGKIDVLAGAGNTGSMLVGSMYTVKAIPGVLRPCITSILPKENGSVGIILDVGTNADCKPDVLYQFAILGSKFIEMVYNISNPKVGLLNIGEEPEKGNLLTQAAHSLMAGTDDFNFIGNVEGRDLFSDNADVIVCDGYTGNVVLKEAEAFYDLIKRHDASNEYFDRFNYELYGGTPILGVNGNVVIGHGSSSALAIKNMLLLARDVANVDLADKLKNAFN